MRVLLVSHTSQSRAEGQAKCEHLARLPGIELRVLIPDRWKHYGRWRYPDVEQSAEAPTRVNYEIGKVAMPWIGPAQFYLHWYPQLSELLRRFRPDVIDLWEEPWGFVSAHACWLRGRHLPGTKIISETEQNINKQLPFPFEACRRYTLRNCDFVIGRNAGAIEVVRHKGYAGPSEIVPNGVDERIFQPMDRDQCRQEWALSGFVAGYVGRLVEEKGLLDLLDALPGCDSSVRLVFVGSGPLKVALEQRADAMGKRDQIRFIPDQSSANLSRIMNALDCLVLPSRTTARWKEQFGRVIIEAHACATPVIGSDSGAIPEVVGAGGIIVKERNPLALAAAIETLRLDSVSRRGLGQLGRKQVEEKYIWGRVAERMASIYRRVVAYQESSPAAVPAPAA